jgi:hypothetical protein
LHEILIQHFRKTTLLDSTIYIYIVSFRVSNRQ